MRVDVSEVKSYRECKRKHQFSSRNRFHLRSTIPNPNLVFGTQFHEVLAMRSEEHTSELQSLG